MRQARRQGCISAISIKVLADAKRYRKLRHWMSSNVKEGWEEIEKLSAIACSVDWKAFDQALDSLPICNVGLCYKKPKS